MPDANPDLRIPAPTKNMYFRGGRDTILISHRFSTVCMADRIYVLEQGCIVESGSNQELMELNGKYARLFEMQAQNYR